jgi:hypothetical protein
VVTGDGGVDGSLKFALLNFPTRLSSFRTLLVLASQSSNSIIIIVYFY